MAGGQFRRVLLQPLDAKELIANRLLVRLMLGRLSEFFDPTKQISAYHTRSLLPLTSRAVGVLISIFSVCLGVSAVSWSRGSVMVRRTD